MSKQLILNADDYGWDEPATEGILELLALDKLSSVSIMANFCTDDALHALKPYTDTVSIGMHVVLNEGFPLLKKENNSLTDEYFRFYPSRILFNKALTRQIKYSDVFKEIKAQRDRIQDFGLTVTHADSHQHIHQYPKLGTMILKALKELGIYRIRNSKPLNIYDKRRFVLNTFCSLTQNALRNFRHPDVLITDFTNVNADLNEQVNNVFHSLQNSPYETVEWMCHPATEDRKGSYLKRKNELDFLKTFDWKELLQKYDYNIASYREV